jgi:DNA-binding response OmpR family regulator
MTGAWPMACGVKSGANGRELAGADLFVLKPFLPDQLVEAVVGLLKDSSELDD